LVHYANQSFLTLENFVSQMQLRQDSFGQEHRQPRLHCPSLMNFLAAMSATEQGYLNGDGIRFPRVQVVVVAGVLIYVGTIIIFVETDGATLK
jgi:hypothetical protein